MSIENNDIQIKLYIRIIKINKFFYLLNLILNTKMKKIIFLIVLRYLYILYILYNHFFILSTATLMPPKPLIRNLLDLSRILLFLTR